MPAAIASAPPEGMIAAMSSGEASAEAGLEADIQAVAEHRDKAAFARIFRRQGTLRIIGFQMIDDSPDPFGAGAIQVDEDRHGIAGVLGMGRIAGDTLFGHQQPGKAATGREHQMDQAAHGLLLQGQRKRGEVF